MSLKQRGHKPKEERLTQEMTLHHVWHCLQEAHRMFHDNRFILAYEQVKNAIGWIQRYWDENPNGT